MVENTNRSFVERLRDRLQARNDAKAVEGEQGSLLLDVLIGMAIFALIALIAVSAINGYRQRAYETGAVSDVQGLAVEIEANYTDAQTYPTAVTAASGSYTDGTTPYSQKVSKGNDVLCYKNNGDGTFKVGVKHLTGSNVDAYAIFDSATGLITKKRGTIATPPAAGTCA